MQCACVEHQRALSTIPSQTREVFVLKTGAPHGVKYNHTGTPDSMKCIQSDYNQNNTTIVSIHHCMIY
ncbi:unnamed protein product, partial [Allacma fusca]